MNSGVENIGELLRRLETRGVRLSLENGEIRFQAPAGALSAQELSYLKTRRQQIFAYLNAEHVLSPHRPIQPRPAGCPVPLTARQLQVWNWLGTQPSRDSLRIGYVSMRINGPLQIALLRASMDSVIQRHESLRTQIVETDGIPQQHVVGIRNCKLDLIDLSNLPETAFEATVRHLSEEFILQRISLSDDPLFAALLLTHSNDDGVLIIAMEHMICDGYSIEIASREIWTVYRRLAIGLKPELSELSVQFPDYAVWQQETYEAWMTAHSAYWLQHLSGVTPTRLPFSPTSDEFDFRMGSLEMISFGKELSLQIHRVAQQNKTMPALAVLMMYAVVMRWWCANSDLLIGISSNGRNRPQLVDMVGWLAGPLYLRLQIPEGACFLDLLTHVSHEFTQASLHYDFNHVPALIPECKTEIYFNWTPIFLRASQYTGYPWIGDDSLVIQPFSLEVPRPLEFLPFFFDDSAGITLRIEYRRDRFSPEYIREFAQRLLATARQFVANPSARIASIEASTNSFLSNHKHKQTSDSTFPGCDTNASVGR